jgi:hypothetical protein
MTIIASILAAAAALIGFGAPTITTPDGWIIPDVPNVTRCVNDDNITMCEDTVTGQHYNNGQPVAN